MEISHQQLNQRAFLGAALVDPAGAHGYILKLTPGMFDEEPAAIRSRQSNG